MKPNDKAIEADAVREVKSILNTISPITDNETIAQNIVDRIIAAFAAQFPPSEDYAGLVKELRDWDFCWPSHSIEYAVPKAADALEALLAERDAAIEARDYVMAEGLFMAENNEDLNETVSKIWKQLGNPTYKELNGRTIHDLIDSIIYERDALLARNKRLQETLSYWNDTYKYSLANEQPPILEDAARLAPEDDDSRHLTAEEQKVFHSALRRSAKIKKPVEDEALVEIVAKVLQGGYELEWSVLPEEWKKDWRRVARAAIAAIRPHIEAAERERCAKIAELHSYPMKTVAGTGYNKAAKEIAAAIRSGK